MQEFSIAVIGAGASGIMAAIYAANSARGVILIERNSSLGKKILISGKGRCNLTNSQDLPTFLGHFSETQEFLRSAFGEFFNTELIKFFEDAGLKLKTERGGRVFPFNDNSKSVLDVLKNKLESRDVNLLYNCRVMNIQRAGAAWLVKLSDASSLKAKRVILATGGLSYPLTGSTGDGFQIAKELGHKIIPLRPGLVPLDTKEPWVRDLSGLTLKNVEVSVLLGRKKITCGIGEMIFTHFGVSGPLILELSSKIIDWLNDAKSVTLKIDLKPGLTEEELNNRLIRDFEDFGSRCCKNVLKELLPNNLIEVCLRITGIPALKKANQVTAQERRKLMDFLKGFSLTVTKARPIEEAVITKGGVSIKEIDPKTMESRLHRGLYFCGEIIDVDADTGGYNLQAAFSTGRLAGKSAAESLN